MRTLLFVLGVVVSAGAVAQTHYVDFYNTAPASVIHVETAPAGTLIFQPVALGDHPLHGGGDSLTLALPYAEGCLRDLRITFADGRLLEHKGFDVCKYRSYHTGRYWHPPHTGANRMSQH